MPLITYGEMTDILLRVRGTKPVTITAYTPVTKMNKYAGEKPRRGEPDTRTPNPYYQRVYKRARVNGIAGAWYEPAVNRRRDKEGKEPDFQALPHGYAEHVPGSPVTAHRNDPERLYLPLHNPKSLGYQYEMEGVIIAEDVINPWLTNPEEGKRQGLDNPLIYRNYLLSNITNLHVNNEWYEIEHPQLVRA